MDAIKKGFSTGAQKVKLATEPSEIEEAMRLRYRIFNEELGEGLPESQLTGMDRDLYDNFCDHLLVMKPDNTVIGTYRLLPGSRRPPEGFYSETEFYFKDIPVDWNRTIELGRACIDSRNRKRGTLMSLFWGMHEYVKDLNGRYLIGCGSLPMMSHDDAEATFQSLEHQGRVVDSYGTYPLPANAFEGRADEGQANIPPLISMYLEFGAKILGRPAYDPIFKCHDLLMFFDMENLSPWGRELLEKFDRRLQTQETP